MPSFVPMETRTLPSRGVQAIGRSESLFRREQGGFLGISKGWQPTSTGWDPSWKMAALPGLGVLAPKAIFFWRTSSGKGRALHARKESITTTPTLSPFGPPAHRKRTGGNAMPRLEFGLGTRTRRPRLSEKTAFRIVTGPYPARASPSDRPPPRRGGLRTPGRGAYRQPERRLLLATGSS